jgi:hypothetical protein
MAERLPEARTTTEPVGPSPAIARKNLVLGLALLGVALLIAVGAVIVALVYLQYD